MKRQNAFTLIELLFDVPRTELDDLQELVKTRMEGALEMKVPIKVEMGFGANWLEAH